MGCVTKKADRGTTTRSALIVSLSQPGHAVKDNVAEKGASALGSSAREIAKVAAKAATF
jgi:hypothetical protein